MFFDQEIRFMDQTSKMFTSASPASAGTLRVFRVQLPTGHIKKMSLDELDAAYRGSLVDEGSFVLTEGSTQWTTLGELLEAADEPPPATAATSLAPPPVVTDLADIPIDFDDGALPDDIPPELLSRRPSRGRRALVAVVLAALGVGAPSP